MMDGRIHISIRFEWKSAFDKLTKRIGLYLFTVEHIN
jgi:hypothetical protein